MNDIPRTVTLEPFLKSMTAGEPLVRRNLTLVPLTGPIDVTLDYILAAEAFAAGALTITEVSEGGSVPELLAINSIDRMILLLDGEELVGAKQNRILNTSVLLPPRSKTRIPVSCVERGRWHHTSRVFAAGEYSPSSLRAMKCADVSANLRAHGHAVSNQGAVWDKVDCVMDSLGTQSSTSALHEAIDQRREKLDDYLEGIAYPAGTRGLVVAIEGRFAAVDLYDRPGTLEKVWPRLVRSYAMDALARLGAKPELLATPGAAEVLSRLSEIPCVPCPSVGVGEDWRLESPKLVGQALVAGKACVHLSAFPS
jgi:hypothetical protein